MFYRHHLASFEAHLGGAGLAELSPAILSEFVAERAGAGLAKTTVRGCCGVLRVFLRYAHRQGLVAADLSKAVEWREQQLQPPGIDPLRIPPGLRQEELQPLHRRVLRPGHRLGPGKRDYAILLLLVTYGLRAREVAALKLDDIDWRRDRLAILGRKAGHSTAFPLLAVVGEALVDYLRHGRPPSADRHVFLRAWAPAGPASRVAVSACARRYLVFLALAGEPRAEGATRVPPAALGRVLGLDRAPEVKTIRRKLGELAAAGKAADLIMALARHHTAARPDALGFLYVDGHARVYYGTRTVQKTYVARLKFPAPATMETWVTGQDGDPVFMVVAEPSDSLAGELRRLLPDLRAIVGEGRRVTVCFDRGGWSPALFADITTAGFDLLTWRKGPAPDLPAEVFTTVACTDDRGRAHEYELADSTAELGISEGPRKGQTVTLRQVTRLVPAKGGGTRQIHVLTSRDDLTAGEVYWRMSARWREENYFRYARTRFALDALDSYAAGPDDPDRMVPNPARKAAAARIRAAEAAAQAAETARDATLLELRSPAPGQAAYLTNQVINALASPVEAALRELDEADQAAAAIPARVPLGTLSPDMVRLETEVKQIIHAIRMAAYNAETALAHALHGHYARAADEAYAVIREALAVSGDIQPGDGELLIRLDPLTPRRTQALAALCDQLTAAGARYPGTGLILRYEVKPHPCPA